MTIDSEYISDLFVGLLLVTSLGSNSSGAQKRSVPPWSGVEALTESLSFVIEQQPKSERRGLPFASIRIFPWGSWHVN